MGKASRLNILYNRLNADFKELPQTGKIHDLKRDYGRKALMPGKRISKNNKIYWETRVNRTDSKDSTL